MKSNYSKIQKKLISINVSWCELEETMGENAALEVACDQHSVSSQWFYDNFADNSEEVTRGCREIWDQKEIACHS